MDGLVHIPLNQSIWPIAWRAVEFKKYLGFESLPLPNPGFVHPINLSDAVLKRRSSHDWSNKPISLQEISNLLYYSCGVTHKAIDPNLSSRAQASAGKRYPIEIYVINFTPGELERFVYHYAPDTHSLDMLWELDVFDKQKLDSLFGYDWAHDAAMAIIITGIADRTTRKYGERGYRYMYLEAGAIAHTMNTIGSIDALSSTIMGGTNDAELSELIDIDGESETLLSTLVFGKKKEVNA